METLHRADSGPYRATRLWNEVIHDFCCGMPLRKHRKHMRCYENCFTASEAVDWLHYYLQRNHKFGPHVTRQQTIQLLQKFVKSGIIEELQRNKPTGCSEEFQDNRNLYRFVVFTSKLPSKSPLRPLQLLFPGTLTRQRKNSRNVYKISDSPPLSPVADKFVVRSDEQDHLEDIKISKFPECCFMARSLTLEEVEKVWRNLALSRLLQTLGFQEFGAILDVTQVHGRHVMHNMTRISKTGVVNLIDKTDDLPHWVLSAMKCLANWPNASGSSSCLPKYPGFENDVFKVVRDYFCNLEKPLIPYSLYHLFMVSFFGVNKEPAVKEPLEKSKSSRDDIEDECLAAMLSALNMDSNSEQMTSTPLGQTSTHSNPSDKSNIASSGSSGSLALDKNPTSCISYRNPLSTNEALPQSPSSLYYETAFTFASPVTRVVPHCCSTRRAITSQSTPSSFSIEIQRPQVQNCLDTTSGFCQHFPSHINFLASHFNNDLSTSLYKSGLSCSAQNIENISKNGFNTTRQLSRRVNSENNVGEILFKPISFHMDEFMLPEELKVTMPEGNGKNLIKRDSENGCDGGSNYDCESHASLKCGKQSCFDRRIEDGMLEIADDDSLHESSYHTVSVYDSLADTWCTVQEPSLHNKPSPCQSDMTLSSLNNARLCVSSDCLSRHRETSSVGVQTSFSDLNSIDGRPNEASTTTNSSTPRKVAAEDSCGEIDMTNKSRTIERLQLSALFIPPANRRALHLLLRLMKKMLQNVHLNLSWEGSMKQLLRETFVRPIICSLKETDYDEASASQFVAFLTEHGESVMEPPASLKLQVEEMIATLQRSKIKYMVDDDCLLTYCKRVTLEHYEDQKHALLQTALSELLEGILTNSSLTERQKRKKLKQFRENHPEVYYQHFPSEKNEKSPHLSRKWSKNLLTKIRTLRL